MIYFAYGSNMPTKRLERRVGKVEVLGTGILKQHQLRFNKKSKDGSLKADAFYTGIEDDQVLGVLYEMSQDQKNSLDKAEGLGKGYDLKKVEVVMPTQTVQAFTYIASNIDSSEINSPYDWYVELILAGAAEHDLPQYYLEKIKLFTTKSDSDAARGAKERATITESK